jgi:hypothetical protein
VTAGAGSVPSAVVDRLSPQALMSAASERTGLEHWGDEGFIPALSLLVESSLATGRLTPTGHQVLRSATVRHLRNRLYVQAHLDRNADAGDAPLEAPLVITGLPRTGTTLLHNLLAQDPRHRFLPLWQALHPVPSEAGQGPDEATLRAQAEVWLERFYTMIPGFRAIHPLTPAGPEECDALLQNAFASQHFDDMFDAEAYSRWFYESDLDREYAYYALQLRILTRGPEATKRWVLKSPGHIGQLESLRRSLPGVRIVHCHRDPASSVPSYASLILSVRRPNSALLSPERIGEQALWRSTTAITRALRARARSGSGSGEEAYFDLAFGDLVAEPIAAVAQIYDWLGVRLDPVAESAMRRWLAENPADRHGPHNYEAAFFGLTPERVTTGFGAYLDRFEPLCAGRSSEP